jgi:hypothetical protein
MGKFWSVLQRKMLVNFKAIWSISLPFDIFYVWSLGIFCGLFGIFFPFWYVAPRKIWQPCSKGIRKRKKVGKNVSRFWHRKSYFSQRNHQSIAFQENRYFLVEKSAKSEVMY